MKKITTTLALIAAGITSTQAATIMLLDENFTGGVFDDASVWSTTDGAGFEVYGQAGFAARGISGGDTPVAPDTRGGIEVLNVATDTTITITLTLPGDLDDTVDGIFTFLAGQRISGSSGGLEGDLEIVNTTDSRTLRAQSAVIHPNFTMAANSVNLDFIADDAGDTIELRFYESGGASDRGLQLADLQLDVTSIPEPSSTALIGLGGLALVLRRRR